MIYLKTPGKPSSQSRAKGSIIFVHKCLMNAGLGLGLLTLPISAQYDEPLTLSQLDHNKCYVANFKEKAIDKRPASLEWVTSSVLLEDESIVLDMDRNRLIRFGLDGVLIGTIDVLPAANEPRKQHKIIQPKYLYPSNDGGYILLDGMEEHSPGKRPEHEHADRILFVNKYHEYIHGISLKDVKFPNGDRVYTVYRFCHLGKGVLVLGYIRNQEGGGRFGFAYLDAGGKYQAFEYNISDGDRDLYLRNLSYLTSIDDIGFILLLEKEPKIGRVQVGSSRVDTLSLPAEFASTPRLKRNASQGDPIFVLEQLMEFYKKIAASRMPVGLYAWKRNLYVLGKDEVTPAGTTAWWLVHVSQDSGQEISRFRVPTTAHHIIVRPGEFSGIFEQGPVRWIGAYPRQYLAQRTSKLTLVPAKWLEDKNDVHFGIKTVVSCATLDTN